jgi:hypothetical protein
LLVFPEFGLSAYPIDDLLFQEALLDAVGFGKIALYIGSPGSRNEGPDPHEIVAVERAKIGSHSSNAGDGTSSRSGRSIAFAGGRGWRLGPNA